MNTLGNTLTATQEIDIATLDQVVGGSSVVAPDLRKQEQGDKLNTGENSFVNRPGGFSG